MNHPLLAPSTSLDVDGFLSSLIGAPMTLGSLHIDDLAAMEAGEIAFHLGVAPDAAERLVAAFALARHRQTSPATPRVTVATPEAVVAHIGPTLADLPHEAFVLVVVDARHRFVMTTVVSSGIRTASLVHPREFFQPAIIHHGAAAIAIHNHPSGDTTPSDDDDMVTDRLARAGDLLGIPLLDHIVIAGRGYYSYREHRRSDVLTSQVGSHSSLVRDDPLAYDEDEMKRRAVEWTDSAVATAWHPLRARWGRGAVLSHGDHVVRVILPGPMEEVARQLIAERVPRKGTPPPASLRDLVERLDAYLEGDEEIDPSTIPVVAASRPVSSFHQAVYAELRSIPRGHTVTYGVLAKRAGRPLAARAVGAAMARNPLPLLVPCHRVLAAGGMPGGFTAAGGMDVKRKLLAIEGVELTGSRRVEPRSRRC